MVWTLTAERGRLILNFPPVGDPIRASTESGEGLFAYLTSLVSQEAKGTKGIYLLGIE